MFGSGSQSSQQDRHKSRTTVKGHRGWTLMVWGSEATNELNKDAKEQMKRQKSEKRRRPKRRTWREGKQEKMGSDGTGARLQEKNIWKT